MEQSKEAIFYLNLFCTMAAMWMSPILAKGLVVQKVLLLTLKLSIGMMTRNGRFQVVQIGKGWL